MEEFDNKHKENKRAILKSTTLLGGSSFITILIGMARIKVVALLLGPSGIGFMGVLTSLQQIVSTITGLGLNSSGVRQIAHSASTKDENAVAITVRSLRISVWATGALGLLVMVFGAHMLSQATFKTAEYAAPIAALGLAILFSSISSGQSCVLQGFRRIGDVAKINVIGAISGTLIGLPCYYLWGVKGVVPSLVLAALASLATSRWYARRVKIISVLISYPIVKIEMQKLIVFGLPLMLSGFITTVTSYIIRVFLNREAGLDKVGLYQAAFSLASVLVNFVLSAMGTDYYPRLTAVADDNSKVNEEVNSQIEIALLLAVPALAATVALMPYIMRIFYSSRFDDAIPILRWAIFGILGRVISWPMGFIILAKAKGFLLFFTELISAVFNIIAFIICFKLFGLPGSGLAFALFYAWHIGLMLIVTKKLSRFIWNKQNIKLILVSIIAISLISIIEVLPILTITRAILGIICFFGISYIYIKKLINISGISLKIIKGKFIK